jgi:hypothetical protein
MEHEIQEATAALVTALEHGDVAAAGDVYAEDATLLRSSCSSSLGVRRSAAPRIVMSGELEQQRVQRLSLLATKRGQEFLLDLLRDRA